MKKSNWKLVYERREGRFYKVFEDKEREREAVHLFPDHPKPVTRRDFLSAGLLSSVATITAPSVLNLLLSREAKAAGAPQLAVMVLHGSGGPGAPSRMVTPLTSAGNIINTAGLNSKGIFANLNQAGVVDTEHNPTGLIMEGNPLNLSLFERDRAAAQAALQGDANNYAWNGVTDAVRDSVLNNTSISFAAVETNDDGGASGQKLAPTPAIQRLLQMAADAPLIGSGLALTNAGNADTGLRTQSITLNGTTPPFLRVTNGESSVRQAIGNPGTDRGYSDAQAIHVTQAMKDFGLMAKNWMSRPTISTSLAEMHGQNVNSLLSVGSLTLNSSVLAPATNTILNSMQNNSRSNLGAAMSAAFQGVSLPLVVWDMNGGDHHAGGGYLNASVAYAKEQAKACAAFLTECQARGIQGIIVATFGGAMKGYSGTDNNTGLTVGASSDEGRRQTSHAIYFNPNGRVAPRYGVMGSYLNDTGFVNTQTPIGGNPENASTWCAAQVASVLFPSDWQAKFTTVVAASALSGLDLDSLPAFV